MPFLGGEEFWLGSEPHSGSVTETKEICNRLGIPGLLRISMIGSDVDHAPYLKYTLAFARKARKNQSV
jgi:hypothetical protein